MGNCTGNNGNRGIVVIYKTCAKFYLLNGSNGSVVLLHKLTLKPNFLYSIRGRGEGQTINRNRFSRQEREKTHNYYTTIAELVKTYYDPSTIDSILIGYANNFKFNIGIEYFDENLHDKIEIKSITFGLYELL
jgi:peptide subunit release factor 1 (eRF1)